MAAKSTPSSPDAKICRHSSYAETQAPFACQRWRLARLCARIWFAVQRDVECWLPPDRFRDPAAGAF